jgi:hypothetical protein
VAKGKRAEKKWKAKPFKEVVYSAEVIEGVRFARAMKRFITTNPYFIKETTSHERGRIVQHVLLPIIYKYQNRKPITKEEIREMKRRVNAFIAQRGEILLREALKKARKTRMLLQIKASGIPEKRKRIMRRIKALDIFLSMVAEKKASIKQAVTILKLCEKADKIK